MRFCSWSLCGLEPICGTSLALGLVRQMSPRAYSHFRSIQVACKIPAIASLLSGVFKCRVPKGYDRNVSCEVYAKYPRAGARTPSRQGPLPRRDGDRLESGVHTHRGLSLADPALGNALGSSGGGSGGHKALTGLAHAVQTGPVQSVGDFHAAQVTAEATLADALNYYAADTLTNRQFPMRGLEGGRGKSACHSPGASNRLPRTATAGTLLYFF